MPFLLATKKCFFCFVFFKPKIWLYITPEKLKFSAALNNNMVGFQEPPICLLSVMLLVFVLCLVLPTKLSPYLWISSSAQDERDISWVHCRWYNLGSSGLSDIVDQTLACIPAAFTHRSTLSIQSHLVTFSLPLVANLMDFFLAFPAMPNIVKPCKTPAAHLHMLPALGAIPLFGLIHLLVLGHC